MGLCCDTGRGKVCHKGTQTDPSPVVWNLCKVCASPLPPSPTPPPKAQWFGITAPFHPEKPPPPKPPADTWQPPKPAPNILGWPLVLAAPPQAPAPAPAPAVEGGTAPAAPATAPRPLKAPPFKPPPPPEELYGYPVIPAPRASSSDGHPQEQRQLLGAAPTWEDTSGSSASSWP